jgi:hypothetical protein
MDESTCENVWNSRCIFDTWIPTPLGDQRLVGIVDKSRAYSIDHVYPDVDTRTTRQPPPFDRYLARTGKLDGIR